MAKSKFTISDFRSSIIATGVARPTRYEIVVTAPPSLKTFYSKEIAIRCKAGNVPPFNVVTKDFVEGQGQIRKAAKGFDHGHVATFTFYDDAYRRLYDSFLSWSFLIAPSHHQNAFLMNYYSDYVGMIEVSQLDETDTIQQTQYLMEAYPVAIHKIELSSEDVNNAQLISVDFAYRYAVPAGQTPQIKVVKRDVGFVPSTAQINDGATDLAVVSKKPVNEMQTKYNTANKMASSALDKAYNLNQVQGPLWNSSVNDARDAVTSQNPQTATAAKQSLDTSFKNTQEQANKFFAASAQAIKNYDEISANLPVTDQLHAKMSSVKQSYKDVSTKQIQITNEYNGYTQSLDQVINPRAIVTL